MTQILGSHEIQKAAALLKAGELVAFPTETVYGLAAPIFSSESIKKIFQVKGRPQDNPLIAHVESIDQVETLVTEIPYALLEALWPGPLTVILPKKSCVPNSASAGLPTIGVRMPAHPLSLELIRAVGEPLVAPSANTSGRPSSTTAAEVLEDLDGKIAAVIDGGKCTYGLESTILALFPSPIILRPGAIPREALETFLGQKISKADPKCEKPLAPGMKYRHYAPRAQIFLFDQREEMVDFLNRKERKRCLEIFSLPSDQLYSLLRSADRQGYEEIAIFCDLSVHNDLALIDRLLKATQ